MEPFSFQASWCSASTMPLFSTQAPASQHSACSLCSSQLAFSSTYYCSG